MARARPGMREIARVARLRLQVHLRAFAGRPWDYLQAVIWRARGLRIRARHRFSSLMGRVNGAYDLWMETREKQLHRALLCDGCMAPLPIDVVIDARYGGNLADSLASILAADPPHEGRVFVVAGSRHVPVAAAEAQIVADAGDLISMLGTCAVEMNAGDTLSPTAFAAYRAALERAPGGRLFYADDDLVAADWRRHSPHFKPNWNAELAKHHDFVSGSCMHILEPSRQARTWPPHRFACSAVTPPVHVPYVLHHRVTRPLPVLPAVPSAPMTTPHVSVVVPTRNQATLLRICLEGLRATAYPNFDVTVIDNGSDELETLALLSDAANEGIRVVRDPSPFNYAAMHNRMIKAVAGPLVCLLNNDVEMLDGDWLSRMVPHAMRHDVGAVGAMLLYPDGTLQHAGIVTGIGGGAGHAHRLQPAADEGYFARAQLPQFVSAVTAACLVVEKAKFEAVGGFDADAFPVAFNDVDLCLKLNSKGWQSFYEPRATLVHHESKSRGTDHRGAKRLRFAGELAALKARWGTDCKVDPFHHPELSRFSEQFVFRL